MVAVPRGSRRTVSLGSGCTDTIRSAPSSASPVDGRAGLGVLLVGDQRVRARARLDGHVLAQLGQLADQLRHHRDP